MRPGLKNILLVLSGVFGVLIIILVIVVGGFLQSQSPSPIQTIVLSDQNKKFVLLENMSGFGDTTWRVYEYPLDIKLSNDIKNGNSEAELFYNYAEAGNHTDYPSIEIQKDKYLVFIRGGYYYSLYDINTGETLVNEISPWHSFIEDSEIKSTVNNKISLAKDRMKMNLWVHKNLHSKIEKILQSSK